MVLVLSFLAVLILNLAWASGGRRIADARGWTGRWRVVKGQFAILILFVYPLAGLIFLGLYWFG